MKAFKFLALAIAVSLPLMSTVAEAGFGRSNSSGISRSYSRPSAPSYNPSRSTYTPASRPAYTPPSQPAVNYTPARSAVQYSRPVQAPSYNNSGYRPTYNSGYGNNNGYNGGMQQRSTMGQIGVTAAGVAGGVLAAQAISSLIASPGHAGMYTHPQYPGQYFNAQGVPQPAPVQQAQQPVYQQPAYQQAQVDSSYNDVAPPVVQQQPVIQQAAPVVVQQPVYVEKKSGGFFSALWSGLFSILHLIFFIGVVAGLIFLGYRLFNKGKSVIAEEKQNVDLGSYKVDLTNNAQALFYGIQANSDNLSYLNANTKYLPVADMTDQPSTVLQFEQGAVDVAVESGKIRGSVHFNATLKKADGTKEKISEYWNFEKDGSWKLIGIDQ